MTGKDYRTATAAEIQHEADRVRRARQAQENHRIPPRTPGARLRDAIAHAKISTKKSRGEGPSLNESLTGIDNEIHNHCKSQVS